MHRDRSARGTGLDRCNLRANSLPATGAALKTVKVFNKKFIAAHTAFLGSIIYDAQTTHQGLAHHKCVEANPYLGVRPSRGEVYKQNLLTFGAISRLDWATARFIKIPYIPYVTPIVETTVHIQGGSKWLTECW